MSLPIGFPPNVLERLRLPIFFFCVPELGSTTRLNASCLVIIKPSKGHSNISICLLLCYSSSSKGWPPKSNYTLNFELEEEVCYLAWDTFLPLTTFFLQSQLEHAHKIRMPAQRNRRINRRSLTKSAPKMYVMHVVNLLLFDEFGVGSLQLTSRHMPSIRMLMDSLF